ncbi:VWA domain-containing protein [Kineobactrum salinum]|uniref:VWA domain-containing protein n=2 Tax=Kineobactrum salinum TaxID=2708301 RepID=A0A6C0U6C5_9GAMM|nr:VWA domain-containing protein [Kineobactrum salinum]
MRPWWLACALPAIVLCALLWRQHRRGGGWSQVIEPELLPYLVEAGDRPRRARLPLLLLGGWLLACLAAAGPSFQKLPQPLEQVQDALVLVLDLSYSMKSTDQAPSRLDRARQKLLDLLQQRREGQTALVAFAGDAHVVAPLTDDIPTIANLLPALNPDMMPLRGSDAAGAIAMAVELLHSAGVARGRILLLSDGVSRDQVRMIDRQLRGSGATLSVLAVGTKTGAPLPLPQGGFLRDSGGAIVIPGLEEAPLRDLAARGGGRYRRLQVDDADIDYLLAQPLLPAAGTTRELNAAADVWQDQGYWLILLLLPLALALFRRGWLLGLLPLLLLLETPPATAQDWQELWLTPDQRGMRALQRDDTARAAELFQDPAWAGTAAYRNGDYETAAGHFASEESADADSWYNRGNALARAGQLDEAIAAYRQSLALEPGATDAAANLELVEQLKQQQQEQEQQSQGEGEDGPQDQGSQDGNDEGQSQAGETDSPEQGSTGDESGEPPSAPEDPSQTDSGAAGEPTADEAQQSPAVSDQQTDNREQNTTPQDLTLPELSMEEAERDQAMELWLRRVPDDPSGLLREKFRYQSRQRQQQQPRSDNEPEW